MTGKAKSKSKSTNSAADDLDFEQAMTQLEDLVESMESGELSLEESLKAFEDGVKLTRECQAKLATAEQRVQLLMEEQGELITSDLDADDGGE
ncbi:exodeoxyribonuclease VII small subunit [Aurantivibrio plasticivorans]